jgi:hypothetical protein
MARTVRHSLVVHAGALGSEHHGLQQLLGLAIETTLSQVSLLSRPVRFQPLKRPGTRFASVTVGSVPPQS